MPSLATNCKFLKERRKFNEDMQTYCRGGHIRAFFRFPIKYAKLGASAKEFLKFVQYDHSTNRLKMAKSLKRGQKNFFTT